MRTASLKVLGEAWAGQVACGLIFHAQWFQVTPLPDDEWEFTVKEENAHFLEWLRDVSQRH